MKPKSRATRRHQTHSKKAAIRKLLKYTDSSYNANDLSDFEARLVRRFNNIQNCSCWGCGNQRRHFGVSIDEQSFDDLASTELKDTSAT